ncbi:MAG: 4'-phosphopantetheinyl transferase superfamily protein [Colwellia sp.]|nr:4'-phosphopantetheinyl transferase superfamily protein [Colwellia sp.]
MYLNAFISFLKPNRKLEFFFNNKISSTVKISACHYNTVLFNVNLFEKLDINMPDSIVKSVEKRQSEFLAGRMMARSALALLNDDKFTVDIGENRSPVWPNNIVGSISHSAEMALCIVSDKCACRYVGCDIEPFITCTTQSEISNSIINSDEKTLIKNSQLESGVAFTLIFSAKESLFKALYPYVKCYFDFRDAEVFDIDTHKNEFKIKIIKGLSCDLSEGTQFSGHYTLNEKHVITFIIH